MRPRIDNPERHRTSPLTIILASAFEPLHKGLYGKRITRADVVKQFGDRCQNLRFVCTFNLSQVILSMRTRVAILNFYCLACYNLVQTLYSVQALPIRNHYSAGPVTSRTNPWFSNRDSRPNSQDCFRKATRSCKPRIRFQSRIAYHVVQEVGGQRGRAILSSFPLSSHRLRNTPFDSGVCFRDVPSLHPSDHTPPCFRGVAYR